MYFFDSLVNKINKAVGRDGYTAFLSTVLIGFITHAQAMMLDAPNHDGLSSMYFDQNMITSGRWFLSVACGFSSYFSLPWFISVLSLAFLGITSVILIKLLDVTKTVFIILISALLTVFPTIASMFAYVFTMDGYMLGLLLSVLAVFMVGKCKYGFLLGGISLAFSMGIYQAYLPVAMLLSLYMVLLVLASTDCVKDKIRKILCYAFMGAIGVGLYYVILKVLLLVQGKELDTYQGINEAASSGRSIITALKAIYVDFISFALKSKIVFTNFYATVGMILLAIAFLVSFFSVAKSKGWLKKAGFYIISLITIILIPACTNAILLVSPGVTYHLLMRYQWVMLLIIPIAFISRTFDGDYTKLKDICMSAVITGALVIAFSYALTDNIAYSNLSKKYEKTYAYCLRLADRIEQTEGYYQGMPVYMIGVVGDINYPVTDITGEVTDHMIGISGDYLVYTGPNYAQFMKNYFGITMNILDSSSGPVLYYEDWYTEMPSFPEEGSIKIVDGVLCVKTENQIRP